MKNIFFLRQMHYIFDKMRSISDIKLLDGLDKLKMKGVETRNWMFT